MNSCPIPATRSQGLPFPCWGARHPAPLESAPSPQPPVSGRMLLLRTLLPRMLQPGKVPRRLRPLVWQLPAASDLHHDLRGCDDGATSAVSVRLQQIRLMMPRRLPIPVQARAPTQAPLSPGGATQPPEPPLELQTARPARYRKTSAATARARWLLLWRSLLRASCGASSARSSICAYSCL